MDMPRSVTRFVRTFSIVQAINATDILSMGHGDHGDSTFVGLGEEMTWDYVERRKPS